MIPICPMKRCLLLLTAALLAGAAAAQARLNVVATTPDWGALAAEIGGDRVTVTVLAKPTEDPHFVDAKPSFIVKLNRADALVEGGAELEVGWLPPLLEGARNPRLAVGQPGRISSARGIRLLEVPAVLDRALGDLHAGGNPHYATDPLNGGLVAATLSENFTKLDPKGAPVFAANLKRFQDRLASRMAEWEKLLAPFRGRRVVAYHNYWTYFAERFGLKMDLYLEPKPGIPPSASHLAGVVATMKAEHVRVIVVQPYANRKTAEAVARLAEATVVDLEAFPSEGKAGESAYLDWIDGLVRKLAGALGSQ